MPETHLRDSELAELIWHSHDAIIVAAPDRIIQSWNGGAEEIYGFTGEEVAGRLIHDVLNTRVPDGVAEMDRLLKLHGRWDGELVHTRRDGATVTVDSRQVLVRDTTGTAEGILEINRDITARKRGEAAVLEAQKLESLGLLAGGLAHEFNNLLTAVMGNVSLSLDAYPTHPARPFLQESLRSSEKAAHLVRQMLAYAGKGRFVIEDFVPVELLRESMVIVHSFGSKKVKFELALADDTPAIPADRAQIRQLFLNLVVNAVEAVSDDGTVAISTSGREFAAGNFPPGAPRDSRPGLYFHLRVADNGSGMDAATRSQIFDPFFSTKFIGRGLGLPAVAGIVRAHHGFLTFESEPGHGTVFDVYLPAARPGSPQTPGSTGERSVG